MRIIWVPADFPALYTLEESQQCIVIGWPVGPTVWGVTQYRPHSVGPASRIGCQQQSVFWSAFNVGCEVILLCQDGAIVGSGSGSGECEQGILAWFSITVWSRAVRVPQ